MEKSRPDDFKEVLNPKEVEELKGQIAALLNYSSPSGIPASIEPNLLERIGTDGRKMIQNRVRHALNLPLGPLKELLPEEVEEVKEQVSVLLNYTIQNAISTRLDKKIIDKLSTEAKNELTDKIRELLGL